MKTILGREIDIQKDGEKAYETAYKQEADVIVTATVLGFIGTRYHLNQPCRTALTKFFGIRLSQYRER